MGNNSFRIGPIRPPSESASLLLQVTNGCTWNKCKFCQLYRHTKFRAYTVDSVKKDIDKIFDLSEKARNHKKDSGWDIKGLNAELEAMEQEEASCYYMVINWMMTGGENVFLQDGNTLVLSGGKLTEVLKYLKEKFPLIKRITSYGRAENLSRISVADFVELKAAGLDRIHSGFESGSDKVLQMVNKGVTAEQEIRAGQNIKAGGIELSVYFMPGLGGKELSKENAKGMAHVISEADPDFVRIRTAAVKPGTELYDDFKAGKFQLCSETDKINEIRLLIEESDFHGKLVSDHIVNLLQDIEGRDKKKMLAVIEEYCNLPEKTKRIYQLARRMGKVSKPSQINLLEESEITSLNKIAQEVTEEEWAAKMNEIICQYI